MKRSISSVFYDKTISILDTIPSFDAEGGVSIKDNKIKDTFKGNIRFINLKSIQEEYGLDYQVDVAISSNTSVVINVGDIISYLDKKYRITDVMPTDSHLLIVGTLWQ